MLSTKIRTTVITLITAFGIATATVSPAVSSAAKNNHGYEKTVGKKNRPWHDTCANAKTSFEGWNQAASEAYEKGETKNGDTFAGIAAETLKNAKASGCAMIVRDRGTLRIQTVGISQSVS